MLVSRMKTTKEAPLGKQIKQKRIQERLSLRQLADQIKVSPGTLSRLERGITMTEIRDTTQEHVTRWLKGDSVATSFTPEERLFITTLAQKFMRLAS